MQQKTNVAVAQGAPATKLSMSFSPVSPAGKKALIRPFGTAFPVFLLVAFSFFTSLNGFSQDTVSHPLSQYGFQITAPSTVLQAGDSATFTVELTLPVIDAAEFNVELELGSAALPPQASDLDFQSTWFASAFPSPPTVTLTSDNIEALLQANPTSSGNGILFEVTLIAGQNDVPARDLIQAGGGHVLVVIEDIGFKQAPVSETAFQIYPNPCSDVLHFNWNGSAPAELKLYNQNGLEVARIDHTTLESGQWTLPNLPAGLYHAVLEGVRYKEKYRVIWLR